MMLLGPCVCLGWMDPGSCHLPHHSSGGGSFDSCHVFVLCKMKFWLSVLPRSSAEPWDPPRLGRLSPLWQEWKKSLGWS